jgi:ribose transport system substrate-binding protein
MKKFLVIFIVIVLALTFVEAVAAAGSVYDVFRPSEFNIERTGLEPIPTKKEPPIVLGFCPTAMNTHYDIVISGVKQEIDALGGKDVIKLVIQAPTGQSATVEQINIFEAWIEQGFDAIAVCTANAQALKPIVKKAVEKGIPVFEFNQPRVPSPTYPYIVSNVGYSQYEAGYSIGKAMVEQYKDRDEVKLAILEGLPGVHNTQRLGGFNDAIKGSNINIVASQPAGWIRQEGRTVTENLLVSNPDIDVLWGMYDEMALGGLSAIKERPGFLDRIDIWGYDNTPDAYEAIKRGEMFATVDTAPKEMGRDIVRVVYKYVIKGEMVPKVISAPIKVYDQSNINEFDTDEYRYVPDKK